MFEAEAKARQREHGGTAPGWTATLQEKLPEVFAELMRWLRRDHATQAHYVRQGPGTC
jgi:hypothetical protein